MGTHRRILIALLMASLLPLVACTPGIVITTPQPQDTVMSCDVEINFVLVGSFLDEPAVTQNFADVT